MNICYKFPTLKNFAPKMCGNKSVSHTCKDKLIVVYLNRKKEKKKESISFCGSSPEKHVGGSSVFCLKLQACYLSITVITNTA
ncbi:hypothetical protein BD560DRAFT_112956 [Blakeslea trispora]|nr:hypothetical protein BD560DRAFT_112956 [Blakeslea trispora]